MYVTKTSPHTEFWVLPQIYTLFCQCSIFQSMKFYLISVSVMPGGAYSVDSRLLTCANEHHIILAIFCIYSIYYYLCELVIHVRFDHDWTVVDGEYWVVHGWMASCKCYNFIRKVLGGIEASKCFAGTLKINKKKFYILLSITRNMLEIHFIIIIPTTAVYNEIWWDLSISWQTANVNSVTKSLYFFFWI